MAWKGSRDEEERGLELSLGLPGYFSGSPGQEGLEEKGGRRGAAGTGAGAKGRSNGTKPSRPSAAAPVVGWPPVRSFRRNLASSSSKPPPAELRHGAGGKADGCIYKGQFVKINMDGIPIGRKVDLKAHDSYGKLAAAVDHLFEGLLAAQRDESSCAGEKPAAITGLLDGSGEYTLVYEDDEGDQMLVGDVPWDMFIATAKRLRVLRSSDLNASSLRAAVSRKRGAAEC
ncbi:Auxin-responsive protein IAA16 [Hordeum vulgare]|uniref:Auxin-responsive protein n=1 Tax=Hordeum vulgare subsp. vulgare TaxID=112509 RepID=F2DY90_HORVV|nr:auxin-responsive protein IAA16-like isoform X1 [Hordeum vulgare subsp. vulgare]KAE8798829.1 Auxin-responsive protein IAA16 [Hordeum vulgare]BAK00062.1 predicted protein [Hordeum vulgare subsp. vulgare]